MSVLPIPRRQHVPESLGWVVARVFTDGRADLASASVYDLQEDADHHAALIRDRAHRTLTITVCQVIPVPP